MVEADWLPVPGGSGWHSVVLADAADAERPNTVLLRSAHAVLLVDPAGGEQRTRQIMAYLDGCGDRPVLGLLTHCHHDHWAGAGALWQRVDHWIAHEQTAAALAVAASETHARVWSGVDGDAPMVEVSLFRAVDRDGGVRHVELDRQCSIRVESQALGQGRQQLWLNGQPLCSAIALPGHTPDSVAWRIGGWLLLGDALATGPGLLLADGWSSEAQLDSLTALLGVLDEGGIEACWPGHGGRLDADECRAVVTGLRHTLGQSGQQSARAARELRLDHAFGLLEEAAVLLEQADESDQAAQAAQALHTLAAQLLLSGQPQPSAVQRLLQHLRVAATEGGDDRPLARAVRLLEAHALLLRGVTEHTPRAVDLSALLQRLARLLPLHLDLPPTVVRVRGARHRLEDGLHSLCEALVAGGAETVRISLECFGPQVALLIHAAAVGKAALPSEERLALLNHQLRLDGGHLEGAEDGQDGGIRVVLAAVG